MEKILNVIDTAYRAHLEEQDDTTLWFIHAIKNSGLDNQDILLTGNCVNYAVKKQKPHPLKIGTSGVPYPSKLHEDLQGMIKKGLKVFFLSEDMKERGINDSDLISEVEGVSRDNLAQFIDNYDNIWHW